MNSVHDTGGIDGFGPVRPEPNEPVFHEPWERRTFGMFILGAGLPPTPLDVFRRHYDRIDPLRYLTSSYYENWLTMMDSALVENGTLSSEEIGAKVQQFVADPELPVAHREDPARAAAIAGIIKAGNPVTRKIRQKPRLAIGDKVVTRNLNPHGHTRLPRYARGKHGTIVLYHGAHVFPDTNAHGLGENPQHLYTVRIAGRELWGDSAEPNQSVLIDMWESYLEKDRSRQGTKEQRLSTRVGGGLKSPRASQAKTVLAKTHGRSSQPATRAKLPKRVAPKSTATSAPAPKRGPAKSKRTRRSR